MAETGLAAKTEGKKMGRPCTATTAGHRDASAQQRLACGDDEMRKPAAVEPLASPLGKAKHPISPLAAWAALSGFLQAGEKPKGLLLSMK
jgi:hypothetical protein